MTPEIAPSETRQDPYVIDVESIIEDPTQLLDFLGEGWNTDNLGLSERSFETQYEKGQSKLRLVFIRDRDTKAIRLSASMSGARERGHSNVSMADVTFIGVYPGPSGFKGMISAVSLNRARIDIRTNSSFRKISMTTANRERVDIEL